MEFYSSKTVTTRKSHVCEYCGADIKEGETSVYEAGKYDGDFFQRYTCPICIPLKSDFWTWCDGECGDIYEYFSEWVCGEKILHPIFTTETACPECGEISIQAFNDDDAECPKCNAWLELEEAR